MGGMRVRVEQTQLLKHIELLKRSPAAIEEQLWQGLLRVHKSTMTQIKVAMPIDTGRARASWGKFTSGDIRSSVSRAGSPNPANSGDAIEELNRGNLEAIQGTHVPYVPRLNAGWSQQAPAGFIDMAEAQAKTKMEEEARNIGLKVI